MFNKIYKTQIKICLIVAVGIAYVILTNNFSQQDIAKFITAYIVATGISFISLDLSIRYFKNKIVN